MVFNPFDIPSSQAPPHQQQQQGQGSGEQTTSNGNVVSPRFPTFSANWGGGRGGEGGTTTSNPFDSPPPDTNSNSRGAGAGAGGSATSNPFDDYAQPMKPPAPAHHQPVRAQRSNSISSAQSNVSRAPPLLDWNDPESPKQKYKVFDRVRSNQSTGSHTHLSGGIQSYAGTNSVVTPGGENSAVAQSDTSTQDSAPTPRRSRFGFGFGAAAGGGSPQHPQQQQGMMKNDSFERFDEEQEGFISAEEATTAGSMATKSRGTAASAGGKRLALPAFFRGNKNDESKKKKNPQDTPPEPKSNIEPQVNPWTKRLLRLATLTFLLLGATAIGYLLVKAFLGTPEGQSVMGAINPSKWFSDKSKTDDGSGGMEEVFSDRTGDQPNTISGANNTTNGTSGEEDAPGMTTPPSRTANVSQDELTLEDITVSTVHDLLNTTANHRLASILQIVVPRYTRLQPFLNPTSPQYRAAHWLANVDPLNLTVTPSSSLSEEIDEFYDEEWIIQRYIMATLFYSLKITSFESKGVHECLWNADYGPISDGNGGFYQITPGFVWITCDDEKGEEESFESSVEMGGTTTELGTSQIQELLDNEDIETTTTSTTSAVTTTEATTTTTTSTTTTATTTKGKQKEEGGGDGTDADLLQLDDIEPTTTSSSGGGGGVASESNSGTSSATSAAAATTTTTDTKDTSVPNTAGSSSGSGTTPLAASASELPPADLSIPTTTANADDADGDTSSSSASPLSPKVDEEIDDKGGESPPEVLSIPTTTTTTAIADDADGDASSASPGSPKVDEEVGDKGDGTNTDGTAAAEEQEGKETNTKTTDVTSVVPPDVDAKVSGGGKVGEERGDGTNTDGTSTAAATTTAEEQEAKETSTKTTDDTSVVPPDVDVEVSGGGRRWRYLVTGTLGGGVRGVGGGRSTAAIPSAAAAAGWALSSSPEKQDQPPSLQEGKSGRVNVDRETQEGQSPPPTPFATTNNGDIQGGKMRKGRMKRVKSIRIGEPANDYVPSGATLSSEIRHLPVLTELALNKMTIDESIWSTIFQLTQLKALDLQFSFIKDEGASTMTPTAEEEGEGVDGDTMIMTLETLDMDYAQIEDGSFPSNRLLSHFPKLHKLTTPLVNGVPIPRDLLSSSSATAALTELRHLDLSSKTFGRRGYFVGDLPEEWGGGLVGSSSTLTYLNLAGNDLDGTLPTTWSQLTALEELYLQDNQLRGVIPPEWAAGTTANNGGAGIADDDGMRNIRILDVSNNDIRGTIPNGWSDTIQKLDVSSNPQLNMTVLPESLVGREGFELITDEIPATKDDEAAAPSEQQQDGNGDEGVTNDVDLPASAQSSTLPPLAKEDVLASQSSMEISSSPAVGSQDKKEARLDALRKILESRYDTQSIEFPESSTKEGDEGNNMIMKWIAYDDPLQLPLVGNIGDEEKDRAVQRYVMTTLLHSLGAIANISSWTLTSGLESECDWTGEGEVEMTRVPIETTVPAFINVTCRSADGDVAFPMVEGIEIGVPGQFYVPPEGRIPAKELSLLPNLTHLGLRTMIINKSILEDVGTHLGDQLTHLDLSWSELSGPFPSLDGQLTKLTSLDLSFSFVDHEEQFPTFVSDLTNLVELIGPRVQGGSIPDYLGNRLTKLKHLDLGGGAYPKSYFSPGTIPKSLGMLTDLTMLDISDKSLEGPIPPEIFDLTMLQRLVLKNNDLVGGLPPENSIGYMSNLVVLDLSKNGLGGPLPEDIGDKLSNLVFFDISGGKNNFTGLVPQSLLDIPNLVIKAKGNNNLQWTTEDDCFPTDFSTMIEEGDGNNDCAIDEVEFVLTLMTDEQPEEVSWKLMMMRNKKGVVTTGDEEVEAGLLHSVDRGRYCSSETLYTYTTCLPKDNGCYDFSLYDGEQDGLCCKFGEGYYEILLDGTTVHRSSGEFLGQGFESTLFGGGCDDGDDPTATLMMSDSLLTDASPREGLISQEALDDVRASGEEEEPDEEVPLLTPIMIPNTSSSSDCIDEIIKVSDDDDPSTESCIGNEKVVFTINLTTHDQPEGVSWVLWDWEAEGGETVILNITEGVYCSSNTLYVYSTCLERDACYRLELYDAKEIGGMVLSTSFDGDLSSSVRQTPKNKPRDVSVLGQCISTPPIISPEDLLFVNAGGRRKRG